MGKVKRKKRVRGGRVNPLGSSGNGVSTEVSNGSNSSGFVQRIVQQVKSNLAEERDSGLNSLANAVEDPKFLREVISEDLIRTVAPLLVDPSPMVRHSAAGALRNISATGAEACDLLIGQDIMTPLAHLLKEKYGKDWTPKTPKDESKIDSISETFIEAVHLLWNLCESNESATAIFNQEGLVTILCPCLDVDVFGLKVSTVVAQCFSVVTEDNPLLELEPYLEKIISRDFGGEFVKFSHLSVLCVGILFNLYKIYPARPLTSKELTGPIQVLIDALDQPILPDINRFSSDLPIALNGEPELRGENIGKLKISFEGITNTIEGKERALEILANIFNASEDEDEDREGSDDDSIEEIEGMSEGGDEEMEVETDLSPEIAPEIYEIMVKNDVLGKILHQVEANPPVNVVGILKEDKEFGLRLLEKLNGLKTIALLCFQNLLPALKDRDLSFEKSLTIWTFLEERLKGEIGSSSKNDPMISDKIEAYTSAQRAIILKWIETKALSNEFISSFKPENFLLYTNIYKEMEGDKIRINMIKLIGGIGILASRTVAPEIRPLILQVAQFLSNCLTFAPNERPWVAAEALDTIFDVFAEDDYNEVLNETGMIKHLASYQPLFKKSIQQYRRQLGENRAVVHTAKSNLSRFIQYKKENGCLI